MHTIKHALAKIVHAIKTIKLTTPVAIIIASIIISGGLMGYGFITKGATKAPVKMFTGSMISDTDYVFGKKNSDVIVIEYSDPECPYCVSLHPTIKQIHATYKDKIAFVYRHFPLTQIHPHAFDEARSMACAGKIGGTEAYYAYINNFFDYKYDNKTTQLPTNGVNMIAQKTNLDIKAFTACMSSQETAAIVNKDQQDGATAGVQGTPSTFVLTKTRKGYEIVAAIDGAQPAPVFMAAIEEALSR